MPVSYTHLDVYKRQLIGKLNQFDIDVPDWVPVIGGKNISFKLPTIPTIKAPHLSDSIIPLLITCAIIHPLG